MKSQGNQAKFAIQKKKTSTPNVSEHRKLRSQPTLLSTKIPDSGTLKGKPKFRHTLIQQERWWARCRTNFSASTPWRAFHSLNHHYDPFSQWQNRYDAATTIYLKLSQTSQQSHATSNE
jgi:hypothetical protein